jgi:hypothetical protein
VRKPELVSFAEINLKSDLPNVEVRSLVAVYRPDDKQYYKATATRKRNKKRSFYLEYNDKDREWIDLCQHRLRLLSRGTRRRKDEDEVVDDAESGAAEVPQEELPKLWAGPNVKKVHTTLESDDSL